MGDDPKWLNEDPQRWNTSWASYYQLAGAQPVKVEEYGRNEPTARKAAEEALDAALKKVAELGLSVEGACWTVKHQSRSQSRRFEPANVKELVTANWHGRITTVHKGIYESEIAEGLRGRTATPLVGAPVPKPD